MEALVEADARLKQSRSVKLVSNQVTFKLKKNNNSNNNNIYNRTLCARKGRIEDLILNVYTPNEETARSIQ